MAEEARNYTIQLHRLLLQIRMIIQKSVYKGNPVLLRQEKRL